MTDRIFYEINMTLIISYVMLFQEDINYLVLKVDKGLLSGCTTEN
ncbi:hypothetical protein SAMN05216464_102172 [Mucilaginibacter pineti]|uniref:Uncharacterized protein n=1 Tax=Mucilaginibacter pineti TaxID=1391627 RepID=A0A1G6WGG4_9SPHI|nr:hypothetical protein SAMN05216464_102172 [Mucilaginibacter pineti]